MATLYDAKPAFQGLIRPLVGRLARAGITANQVTVGAVVLSLGWGAAALATGGAAGVLLALPAVLLLRMGLNAADGMLAREHGQASRPGFFLNEIGDVVSDAALYLPLALLLAPGHPVLAAAVVLAVALTEFAGVLGQAAGGTRRYDGPFGKSDRAAFFSVVAVLMVVPGIPATTAMAVLAIALGLAAVTVVNRIRAGLGGEGDGA